VRIETDRVERFAVPPAALWAAMSSTAEYRTWWPWLRHLEAEGLVAGDTWSAVVQPPLPYRLAFTIALEVVEAPVAVHAVVGGDLEGWARLELSPQDGGGCRLHLESALAPTAAFVQTVARFAPPVARFGHRWVLDTGLAGFRRHALRSEG
jgi:uncharacterized protein YndB with AHSA1/START domain